MIWYPCFLLMEEDLLYHRASFLDNFFFFFFYWYFNCHVSIFFITRKGSGLCPEGFQGGKMKVILTSWWRWWCMKYLCWLVFSSFACFWDHKRAVLGQLMEKLFIPTTSLDGWFGRSYLIPLCIFRNSELVFCWNSDWILVTYYVK